VQQRHVATAAAISPEFRRIIVMVMRQKKKVMLDGGRASLTDGLKVISTLLESL
jgi:hypothetical protein